ncbi:hypothetical protein XI09_10645 [Bradyrhizobium sp. CCBAU 11386]|nr:hypothetical protein [Bradyrhizobium sp. CCBAU 11386]
MAAKLSSSGNHASGIKLALQEVLLKLRAGADSCTCSSLPCLRDRVHHGQELLSDADMPAAASLDFLDALDPRSTAIQFHVCAINDGACSVFAATLPGLEQLDR